MLTLHFTSGFRLQPSFEWWSRLLLLEVSWFHARGAATQKALSPIFRWDRQAAKSLFLAECANPAEGLLKVTGSHVCWWNAFGNGTR